MYYNYIISENALYILTICTIIAFSLQLKELRMVLVYSELCTPHVKPYLKAVASCLKCSVLLPSRESPTQSIYVLTGLSDESPRRPGPLAALLKQSWPRGATWRHAKMYSALTTRPF